MENPLLDFSGLPRFDEVKPEHVGPAVETLLSEGELVVRDAEALATVSWATLVSPLEDISEKIGRAWGQVGHLMGVVKSAELRTAYNENLPKVTAFGTRVSQSLALFEQYRKLAQSPEYGAYDPTRLKLVDNILRDFRLSGAELPEAEQKRFAAIRIELSELASKFSDNVLDATDAFVLYINDKRELSGIPDDDLAAFAAAAAKDGKAGWKLSLQMPVVIAVLTYCDNRALREQLYRANGLRASEAGPPELDNTDLIRRILKLRQEQAVLLGYASYADYSLATKMAQSPQQVLEFLRDLGGRALPYARKDRAELEQFAKSRLDLATLESWDIAYVSEKLMQEQYRVSAQEVKAYLTEPTVLSGLFAVIKELYGLSVKPDTAPVWHEDVRFFRLQDANGDLVGQFYLDLYAREGKRGGAWMDDCRNYRPTSSGVQTPVVLLTCNFGKGADGKPSTLTHDDVITLFHETGHGLHQLLTEARELAVAGINGVEWDAVELPSQFMENFCWEWTWLERMTAHVDTGETMPHALYDRMIAAKNFQSGMQTVRQLEFSLFDMLIHAEGFNPVEGDVMDVLDRVRDEVAVNRAPAWHRFPQAFSHIFAGGYAAGYYSYKWAEVLSADAYAAFEEANDLAAMGERFRREVLSRGGSRTASENFQAFRGREPKIDALLRHSGLQ